VRGSVVGAGERGKSAVARLLELLKVYVLCLGRKGERERERAVRVMMAVAAVLLVLSCYPLARRALGRK
jgi:hypothetical protein